MKLNELLYEEDLSNDLKKNLVIYDCCNEVEEFKKVLNIVDFLISKNIIKVIK